MSHTTIDIEPVQTGSNRQRSRSIIREFSLNTSTHGIPGIARSTSIHNRIFWSIALLIFIGVMLFFIIKSIISYFEYPTQTSIDIVSEWPQAFPAVTVCNYSPFLYNRFIRPFINYTNTFNMTNTTDTAKFTRQQASYVPDFLRYTLDQGNSLKDFAFPLDSMLISCSYNDMACSSINFTSFSSLRYGICYTFNAKPKNLDDDDDIRYSSDNGGDGRLALSFYVHRQEYVPYLTSAIGMMAMIHSNDQFPLIAFSGLQLSPGKNHKLSYTKRTNTFLPSPYTSYTNDVSLAMQAMIDRYQSAAYGYTQSICYTICMQTVVYQKCSCVSPANWITRFIVLPGTTKVITAPLCNWTDICAADVASDFIRTDSYRDTQCPECGPECQSDSFDIKASSLTAPVDFQMEDIKKFVETSSVPLPTNWSTTWKSEIPLNYISLEVVCETTRTEIYTQQATIGPVDLLSNIGGQTGLWIGISFLSLLEIVEMLYRLIRSRCHILSTCYKQKE